MAAELHWFKRVVNNICKQLDINPVFSNVKASTPQTSVSGLPYQLQEEEKQHDDSSIKIDKQLVSRSNLELELLDIASRMSSEAEAESVSSEEEAKLVLSDVEETVNPLAAFQEILVQLQQKSTQDNFIVLEAKEIEKIYLSIENIVKQSQCKEIFQELKKLNLSTESWEKLLLKIKTSNTTLYKAMLFNKQIADIVDTATQNLGDHEAVLKIIHKYMVSDVTHPLESSELLRKVLDNIRSSITPDTDQKIRQIYENGMLDVKKKVDNSLQHDDLTYLLSLSPSPPLDTNMALLIEHIKAWIGNTIVNVNIDKSQHVQEPYDTQLQNNILAGIRQLDLKKCNQEAIAILFHYLADMGSKVLCEGGTIINSFHDEIEKKLRNHQKQLSEVQTPNTGSMPKSSIISPGVPDGNRSNDPSTVLAEQPASAQFSRPRRDSVVSNTSLSSITSKRRPS